MELHLTPEQEARLVKIAQHQGKATEQLLTDAAFSLLEDDDNFHLAVREGLAQADAGDFIEEEEMDARFEKMMRR